MQKNKTIGIALYPERGGYYPSFKLAKKLINSGFRVIYYGTHEFEREVVQQELEMRVVFSDKFINGTFDGIPLPENASFVERYKHAVKTMYVKISVLLTSIVSGELIEIFKQDKLDLLVVDSMLPSVAVGAYLGGIPVLRLSTTFVAPDHTVAPFISSLDCAQDTFLTRIKIAFIWYALQANFITMTAINRLVSKWIGVNTGDAVFSEYQEMMKKTGFKFKFLEYGLLPDIPEFVLAPSCLEFRPEISRSKRSYIGHCIDLYREEPDFPWDKLDIEKPIVICSLGTHVADYRYSSQFFVCLLNVARDRPDLSFVISVGPGREISDYGVVPENVIASLRIPQLALLAKAKIMITNAGLGTVKECVYFGVPMLALPCDFDQPSNAARVVSWGIGRRDQIKDLSETSLKANIEALISDPSYKNKIDIMSAILKKDEEFNGSVDGIISLMKTSL